MTSYGPPYEQGGQQWGPPPNTGGYGPPPGGPVAGAKPAAALWPIILVTVFFALFGLIPTIIASNRASQRRESTSRYWIAFVVSFIGSIVLYVVVTLVLTLVVFATAVTTVAAGLDALPTSPSSVSGFPSSSSASPTASDTGSGGAGGAGATDGPCAYTPDGSASATSLPDDPDPTPTDAVTWTLVTSAGTVVIALDAAAAPCTVQSIVHLTDTGYFDDTPCPRSVNEGLFILQCGDPTGTGAGGPGYTFGDEDLPNADYSKGAVAMANSGADTNGSQFFIVDKDGNDALAKNYTVFGTVTSGLDVVDTIVAAGNDGSSGAGGGTPTPAVSIVSATTS